MARTVERSLFGQGVEADAVQALLDQAYRADQGIVSVIDVLMPMAIVVGILGLGIVALRAVTERRHVIGILSHFGFGIDLASIGYHAGGACMPRQLVTQGRLTHTRLTIDQHQAAVCGAGIR